MTGKVEHATITLERAYQAPVERVFSEFADPVVRAQWSPPSEDSFVYDEADFRVGGKDVFRCGPRGDLKFRGETRYLLILPNVRVVFSETLDTNGQPLAASLTTLEFEPAEGGAKLKVTVQLASFVGPGMVAGYESGNRSALENLAHHLSK